MLSGGIDDLVLIDYFSRMDENNSLCQERKKLDDDFAVSHLIMHNIFVSNILLRCRASRNLSEVNSNTRCLLRT